MQSQATTKPKVSKLSRVLVMLTLVALMLTLTACSYPGQNDCTGVGNDGSGFCNSGSGGYRVSDGGDSPPWYVGWIIDAIKAIITGFINAVIYVATEFFGWMSFNTLNLDFAGCNSSYGGPTSGEPLTGSITCTAWDTWNTVRLVFGLSLLPLAFIWKLFKSKILGIFIDEFGENAASLIAKFVVLAAVLGYLDVIYTSVVGLSELLFSIIAGPTLVGDLITQIKNTASTLSSVNDIGVLLMLAGVTIITAIVFFILGIAFFVRSILITIFFVLSAPAAVGAATDEFRPWFGRWQSAVQSTLISPIVVAICLVLSSKSLAAIASARTSDSDLTAPIVASADPFGYAVYLLYVTGFLMIGCWFMLVLTAGSARAAFAAGRTALRGLGFAVGAVGSGAALGGKGVSAARSKIDRDMDRNAQRGPKVVDGQASSGVSSGSNGSSATTSSYSQNNDLTMAIRSMRAGMQEQTRYNYTATQLPAGNVPQLPPGGGYSYNYAPRDSNRPGGGSYQASSETGYSQPASNNQTSFNSYASSEANPSRRGNTEVEEGQVTANYPGPREPGGVSYTVTDQRNQANKRAETEELSRKANTRDQINEGQVRFIPPEESNPSLYSRRARREYDAEAEVVRPRPQKERVQDKKAGSETSEPAGVGASEEKE